MRFIVALVLSGLIFSGAARAEAIGEADLLKHIEILASDAFEGRGPGTIGENKTVNYIATQWAEAGLKPAGEKDSWYKPVTLVERVPESFHIVFSAAASGRAVRLRPEEIVLRGREPSSRQADMALVFAGYAEAGAGSPSVAGKLVLLPSTPPEDRDELPDYRTRKSGPVGAISALLPARIDNIG